ncbi:SIR2 family protein [Mycoplasma todarodis]|uniref:Uncharacterized protein n=1 Tax=Mycoplasma todarodis TaxID=1937191 RepID=A0A4R0XW91_9MOLU|nr:SIR2 family protein [Mycoplasma todarodis]TCG12087.1 hypothetical protein C4B25_00130 [Mycoplasma todarodis]
MKKNIKVAATILANRIGAPIKNKKVTFLFGAGINYNIAEGAKSWGDLALNSLEEFVNDETELSKNISSAFAKQLLNDFNNNKLSLSFSKRVSIKKIKPLPQSEVLWFKKGYETIKAASNNNISTLTFNYDRVLEDVLFKKSINTISDNFNLTEASRSNDDFLYHIHGLADEEGYVDSKETLLSLGSYVKKTSGVRKVLEHFLNNKRDAFRYETIVIIGSSLSEEHILQTLSKIKNDPNRMVEIFWICYFPIERFIENRIRDMYKELNINILNIKTDNESSFKKNFRKLWEYMTKLLNKSIIHIPDDLKKILAGESDGGSAFTSDDITNDIYNIFLSKLKLEKKGALTFEEAQKKIGLKKPLQTPNFLSVVNWLENDGYIKKGEMKKYFFNCDPLPINNLHWLKEVNKKELELIMETFDKTIKYQNNNFHNSFDFSASVFITKYFKEIDFDKYKNIQKYLIINAISRPRNIRTALADKVVKNFTLLDLENHEENERFLYSTFYEEGSRNLTKIIQRTLEFKKDFYGIEIPKRITSLPNFIMSLKNDHNIRKIVLIIFSIKKYRDAFLEQVENISEAFANMEKMVEKMQYAQSYRFLLLRTLCQIFLNTKYETQFIKEISKQNTHFSSFPETNHYRISSWSDGGDAFSKYDGQPIDGKTEILNIDSWKQVNKMVEQKEFNKKEFWNAFQKFLSENNTLKDIEILYGISELEHCYVNNIKNSIKEMELEEYICFLEMRNRLLGNERYYSYDYLDIKPAFDNKLEIQNSINILEVDAKQQQIFKTLKKRIKIQNYDRFSIWADEDTTKLLEIYKREERNNKYIEEMLDLIFEKVYKWKPGYFKEVLDNSSYETWEGAQLYIRYQSTWNSKMPTVNQAIELYKLTDKKTEQWNAEAIIYFLFVNQQEKDPKTLIDFLQKENGERNVFEFFIRKIKHWYIWRWIKNCKEEIPFSEIELTKWEVAYFISNIDEGSFEKYSKKLSDLFVNNKTNHLNNDEYSTITRMINKRMTHKIANFLYTQLEAELVPIQKNYKYSLFPEDINNMIKFLSPEKSKKLKRMVKENNKF